MTNWRIYPKEKPSQEKDYLCTIGGTTPYIRLLDYFTSYKGIMDKDYEWRGEGFYVYDNEWGYGKRDDVIAWMELPEPYKENYDSSTNN